MRLWIGLISLLLCPHLIAQECALTLPVGVFTKEGERIPALTVNDFVITVNRVGLAPEESLVLNPHRFVIVLDASSSMRGSSRKESLSFDFARAIALRLTSLAPAEIGIGTVTLGAGPIRRAAISTDRLLTKQVINDAAIQVRFGTTPLWDAIAEGSELLRPVRPGDFIVLLTDSGSNTSKLSRHDVTDPLVGEAIRVFPIVLSHETPRTLDEYQGPDETDRLAQQTGGVQLRIEVPERGNLAFDQAAEVVAIRTLKLARSYYALRLRVDRNTPGKKVKIKLADKIAKTTLMYPEKLPSCQSVP